MIAVSAALKIVTVAYPSGLAVAESVIFPFNIPCDHDKLYKKKNDAVNRIAFFMLLVYGYTKTNLYDIIRIGRAAVFSLTGFLTNGQ